MALRIETPRLVIQPYSNEHLEAYYRGFTAQVARYQYPDAFASREEARETVSAFLADMARGEMLELVILDHAGEFLGSMEAFGLGSKRPEVGLWLKESAQGQGYGCEALRALIAYLDETKRYSGYVYEVDERNAPSIRLVRRFPCRRGECEDVTTPSGKVLHLAVYTILSGDGQRPVEWPASERLGLVQLPTPMEGMPRLRDKLGCEAQLLVKRDDATTVGMGGNKTRKLELVLAQAVKQGADTLITYGGTQSNHCRQTAAYAVKLGMDCHLVLDGRAEDARSGNVLLDRLYGAALHFVPREEDSAPAAEALAASLRAQGRHPFVMEVGASTPLGVLAYAECAREMLAQAEEAGVQLTNVFCATGTAGTAAGLILGFHGEGVRVHAVSVSAKEDVLRARIRARLTATFAALGQEDVIADDEFDVLDEFVGAGYAIPTTAGNAAIRLLARTEALILDPVYTGKCMAGMLDWLAKNERRPGAVAFVHTGGSPAIYRFEDALMGE